MQGISISVLIRLKQVNEGVVNNTLLPKTIGLSNFKKPFSQLKTRLVRTNVILSNWVRLNTLPDPDFQMTYITNFGLRDLKVAPIKLKIQIQNGSAEQLHFFHSNTMQWLVRMWAIFWQTHFGFRFPTYLVQNFDIKNMKSYKCVIENLTNHTNIIKESWFANCTNMGTALTETALIGDLSFLHIFT